MQYFVNITIAKYDDDGTFQRDNPIMAAGPYGSEEFADALGYAAADGLTDAYNGETPLPASEKTEA